MLAKTTSGSGFDDTFCLYGPNFPMGCSFVADPEIWHFLSRLAAKSIDFGSNW